MKSRYRFGVVFSILCVVLFVLFVMAIGVVTSNLDAETAYKIAANKITGTEIYEPYWPLTHETIIWEVRLPRVLLSIICCLRCADAVCDQKPYRRPICAWFSIRGIYRSSVCHCFGRRCYGAGVCIYRGFHRNFDM